MTNTDLMTTNDNPTTDSALPAGWRWARLGEVCDLYQPKTIKVKELVIDGPYPVFGANGIIGKHDQYNHEYPEVIVTCRGATCGTVNMSHPKSWVTGNAMVTKPSKDAISKKFLYMLLRASDLSFAISGSAQPQITRQSLARLPIPLPPLSEQRRIARVLDECLALVARAKDAAELQLEAAVALPGAYLRQALPAEGGTFHRVPFKSVCTLEYGTSLRRKDRINGPYPVMGSNGVSGYHNKYLIQGPAIIVGRKGSAGEVNYVKSNCFPIDTTYYVKLVDSKQTDLVYLYYLLKSLDLPSLRGGSAIPGLNRNDVYSKHQLPLPPLDEQRRIASDLDARISVAGTLVSRIRDQLDAIDALPGAYLRKAFAGEI